VKANQPLLSIVIPFFNAVDLISNSINSLLAQTIKDFEIILVNDGSIDKTRELVVSLLTDSKLDFRIFDQENLGVSSARNAGMRFATGKYVYFLDADDVVCSCLVEKIKNFIDTNVECEIVVFGYNILNYNKELIKVENLDGYPKVEDPRRLLVDILKMRTSVHTESIVYKKSFLDYSALLFNDNMKFGEDQEFSLKAIYQAKQVGCINEQLVFYIKHLNAATSLAFNRSRFGMLKKYEHFNMILNEEEDYLHSLSDSGKVFSAIYLSYMICNSLSFRKSMEEICFMMTTYFGDIKSYKISLKAKFCYTVVHYIPQVIYITKSIVTKLMFPISNVNKNKD